MKKLNKKDLILKQVKMNRAARREADIEFQIPHVKHMITIDRKKELNKYSCRNKIL